MVQVILGMWMSARRIFLLRLPASQKWKALRRKIEQDSTNSSKAPSTDSSKAKAKQKKIEEKAHKRQAAQPGYKAIYKSHLELRENDTVVDCVPEV